MVYTIRSCTLVGLEVHAVVCEVDLSLQIPSFTLVGLPSAFTQESRERVRAAVVNSGFQWPARKVTVNLLPADLPKWGSHFELAMALAIVESGATKSETTMSEDRQSNTLCRPDGAENDPSEPRLPSSDFANNVYAIGEVSLSGRVRPCGWLPAAARWLFEESKALQRITDEPLVLIVHEDDAMQLRRAAPQLTQEIEIATVKTLSQAVHFISSLMTRLNTKRPVLSSLKGEQDSDPALLVHRSFDTLEKVVGEPLATVAALVAIAGRHQSLFVGPHGVGKSMLVRAICEAAGGRTPAESAEIETLSGLFGEVFSEGSSRSSLPIADSAAFARSSVRRVVRLQTSVSRAALEGAVLATGQVVPGELTRAHHGVLVLDELLEFRRDVIEAFRQPLDDGFVRVQRAKFRMSLPSRFQLLATTNLCACGEVGRTWSRCRCTRHGRAEYQKKLSGPFVDRFDLCVLVGQGLGSMARPIPADVAPLVRELEKKEFWHQRVSRIDQCRSASNNPSESDVDAVWSRVSCSASPRGRLKIMRVALTVAGLLDQPLNSEHLRLAVLLRDGLRFGLEKECLTIGEVAENRARAKLD